MTSGAPFVLVHGAWRGGWIWREVANILRSQGHRVFTPTLTGLAERSHLASPAVNVSAHIADIAGLIQWEELSDIVLVGHSYSGMVITGLAERAPAGVISSIVYLDALLPEDGQSALDLVTGVYSGTTASPSESANTEDWLIPPVPAVAFNPRFGNNAWIDRLATPQPIATRTERLRLSGARERIALKTYVRATGYELAGFRAMIARFADRICKDPSWRYEEIGAGHDLMATHPKETAEILLRAANR